MTTKIRINNFVIKEKAISKIPLTKNLNHRFSVFSPDGRFLEDNLTLKQAQEFCKNDTTFLRGKR
jgi:hypothetical protein